MPDEIRNTTADLAAAGWLNPDGTQATYSPEELELLRAQKREGNRLAKEAWERRRMATETTKPNELDDAEIERIQNEAEEAAVHCIHMAAARNPYAGDEERAEVWSFAFRQAYARENGY